MLFWVISDLRRQDDVRSSNSIINFPKWLNSPFFLQTPTIVENLKQKLARNFICIKGQRSLNEYTMEYTKLRQAAEGWWKQIFFFALLPSKISWWNCCTNMLMSIRQRVQCPKVRSYVLIYHVWNSRSWPLAVNTLLLQHNSICRMERTVGPNSKNPPKNKIREINWTSLPLQRFDIKCVQ